MQKALYSMKRINTFKLLFLKQLKLEVQLWLGFQIYFCLLPICLISTVFIFSLYIQMLYFNLNIQFVDLGKNSKTIHIEQ